MCGRRFSARRALVGMLPSLWDDWRMSGGLRRLIREMHTSRTLLVYEFAGGGSQALTWLHEVDGSSQTLLEAVDHCVSRSLDEVVRDASCGTVAVEQAATPEVAAALAQRAYGRARALAPGGVAVVGVGCAVAGFDRPKRDELRGVVVVEGPLGRHMLTLALNRGERHRDDAERLVSTLVLHAAATGCGVMHRLRLALGRGDTLKEGFEPVPALGDALACRLRHVALTPAGELNIGLPWPGGIALISGSFNPLHWGHLRLAAAAQAFLDRPTIFELALHSVEKHTLTALELYARAMQFPGRAPVLFTWAAPFAEKAMLYPGSVFVVGVDTAARMLSQRHCPRYRGVRTALDAVRAYECRFLVAGRQTLVPGGAVAGFTPSAAQQDATVGRTPMARFVTLSDLDVPAEYTDLFEALPEDAFRADVSSSLIREEWDRFGAHT